MVAKQNRLKTKYGSYKTHPMHHKNEKIPTRKRLDQAMVLLQEISFRNGFNKITEILCLGSAVHKYKWQQFSQARIYTNFYPSTYPLLT
ncbi:MAG: hypothetical protein FCKEOINB_00225 [Nitrosomonas sp.]|nr:hypothetical protein [Nitrosomonas sp.]